MTTPEVHESVAWEWRRERPEDWGLGADEIWSVSVVGHRVAIAALQRDELSREDRWITYVVLTVDQDGIDALEAIDSYDTIGAAKGAIDENREQLIAIATGE